MYAAIFGDDLRPLALNGSDSGVIGFDTETTGLKWEDELIGCSFAWRQNGQLKSTYLKILTEKEMNPDQPRLFDTEEYIDVTNLVKDILMHEMCVCQWLPFDFRIMFKTFGTNVMPRSMDTIYLARSTSFQSSYSLPSLVFNILDESPDKTILDMKGERASLANKDLEKVAAYGRWDAEKALRLYEVLKPRYDAMIPHEMASHDCRFQELVQRMVVKGVPINRKWIAERKEAFVIRMDLLREQCKRLGIKDISSDAQIRKYLKNSNIPMEKTTQTGLPSVDIETLEVMKDVPGIAEVIEFRQLQKAVGSWFDDLMIMSEWDGNAHPILDPFGTKSFRMSSASINFQGIPVKDKHRAFGSLAGAFGSDYLIQCQADLKQAEPRMATILSKENSFASSLSHGVDPYASSAEKIWNDANRREDAKRAVLATLYEIGPNTFSQKHKVSIKEAKDVLDSFRNTFPQFKEASNYWSNFVEINGYVPTYKGRKIFFGPTDANWKAFNQRVQGSVSEFMQDFMLMIDQVYPDLLDSQVHDSVWYALERGDEKRYEEISGELKLLATKILPEKLHGRTTPEVPFLLDVERIKEK